MRGTERRPKRRTGEGKRKGRTGGLRRRWTPGYLARRRRRQRWPGSTNHWFLRAHRPVCSPRYRERRGNQPRPTSITRCRRWYSSMTSARAPVRWPRPGQRPSAPLIRSASATTGGRTTTRSSCPSIHRHWRHWAPPTFVRGAFFVTRRKRKTKPYAMGALMRKKQAGTMAQQMQPAGVFLPASLWACRRPLSQPRPRGRKRKPTAWLFFGFDARSRPLRWKLGTRRGSSARAPARRRPCGWTLALSTRTAL